MARTTTYHAQLATLDLFDGCSREELAVLASNLTRVTVPAGSVLIREGSAPSQVFVIEQGSAEVTVTEATHSRMIATVTAGEALGEMGVLFNVPANATVVATTDITVYVATPREFSTILHLVPRVADRIEMIAAERHQLNRQLAS